MIWFKACPRCKLGDLYLNEDIYGKYRQCLQCGHVIYSTDNMVAQEPIRLSHKDTARKKRMAA
jgi:Zn ribbon nucleic-acid-binding protein